MCIFLARLWERSCELKHANRLGTLMTFQRTDSQDFFGVDPLSGTSKLN